MVLKEVFGVFKHHPSSPVTTLMTLAFANYAILFLSTFNNLHRSVFLLCYLSSLLLLFKNQKQKNSFYTLVIYPFAYMNAVPNVMMSKLPKKF